MKTVVIAEKPDQKRKLLEAYNAGSFPELGSVTFVNARGHLYELVEPEAYSEEWDRKDTDGKYKLADQIIQALPIYPESFDYKKKSGTASLIKEVNTAIEAADLIIIATDPDTEGASIAWKIIWRTKGYENKVIKNLIYNAQTLQDFKKAFENPVDSKKFIPMAYQAITREQSDWLVGMNASRIVTALLNKEGYYGGFPVGRVQTPTVAKIVQRELEIQNYDPKQNVRVTLKDETNNVTFKGVEGIGEFRPTNGGLNAAQDFYNLLAGGNSIVKDVSTSKKEQQAPALFKLSKLQAEASRKFKWTPKKTSEVYQKLYEQGWVSYPRTDDQHIAPSEFDYLIEHVQEYLALADMSSMPVDHPEPRKKYVTDKAIDHSANIPSSQIPSAEAFAKWDQEAKDLYLMIVKRTMLMFARTMLFDETEVLVENSEYVFKAKGKVITDLGWSKYTESESKDVILPIYEQGTEVSLTPQMDSIAAPKRYTETDMTDHVMSAMGLGRPSTYAPTIEKIEQTYINREAKRGELSPKPEAFILIDFLSETMLTKPELTANWEVYLDNIGAGEEGFSKDRFIENLKLFLNSIMESLPQKHGTFGNISPEKLRETNSPVKKSTSLITTPYGEYQAEYVSGKSKNGKFSFISLRNNAGDEIVKIWGKQYFKELTEKQLKVLVTSGEIKKVKFKKKDGGDYTATLKLNSDFKVERVFE